MPQPNIRGSLSRQRAIYPTDSTRAGFGVVGDAARSPRDELDESSADLPINQIEIERLHDNPFQYLARPHMDDAALDELADSIRSNGFYGALVARPKPRVSGAFELAYGHRRREAALRAGLATLPIRVVNLNDSQMAQLMASENFSREDLQPIGEANIVGYFYSTYNMTLDEIAATIGKKRSWVQSRLAIYESPPDVRSLVEQYPQTLSVAPALGQLKDSQQRSRLIAALQENKLTVEQVQNAVRVARQGGQIDNFFTSGGDSTASEEMHNVSRETPVKKSTSGGDSVASEEIHKDVLPEVLRLDALKRVDRAVSRLARVSTTPLTTDEHEYLAAIHAKIGALLGGRKR